MAEYTWDDIIIDPTSKRAKEAVGKDCFVSNIPTSCLEHANENDCDFLTKLNSINLNLETPFNVNFDGEKHNVNCIIVKKEEQKPKYIPFESIEEFVERYTEVKKDAEFGTFEDNLLRLGVWIKSKDNDDLSQVTVIKEYGICIDTMSTIVLWENLLDDFEFIDGTPCGKEVEE